MNISTHGTAFTSYDVKANKQTKEEISEENISFDDTIKQTNEVEDVVYHTTTKADNSKPTTFIDPVTKKYVIASLENETLDKLRDQFGKDDVVEKEDGSIRLTGEAESFVSGWFADIAYNREFLTADENSDGQLSEEEYSKTKNNFGVEGFFLTEYSSGEERLLLGGEKIIKNSQYISSSGTMISTNRYGEKEYSDHRNYRNDEIAVSLDDELNTTLQGDKDFNGKLNLEEAYSVNGNNAKDVVLKDLSEWGISTIPSEVDTSSFDDLLNFILDVFLQKDKTEQEKTMLRLNEMMTKEEELSTETIEQLYTENHLEHIQSVKNNNQENIESKIEIYK